MRVLAINKTLYHTMPYLVVYLFPNVTKITSKSLISFHSIAVQDRDLIIRDRDRDQDLIIRDRDHHFRDQDL